MSAKLYYKRRLLHSPDGKRAPTSLQVRRTLRRPPTGCAGPQLQERDECPPLAFTLLGRSTASKYSSLPRILARRVDPSRRLNVAQNAAAQPTDRGRPAGVPPWSMEL